MLGYFLGYLLIGFINFMLCLVMMYFSSSLGEILGSRDFWTTVGLTLLSPIGFLLILVAMAMSLVNINNKKPL